MRRTARTSVARCSTTAKQTATKGAGMSAETIPAENVEALIEVLLDVDERLAREGAEQATGK